MAETFVVETRGIGKPDYTREVSSARERAGIVLKANQQFRVFAGNWSAFDADYPFIPTFTIAAGAKRHMSDSDTGALLPITIPKGRTLTIISVAFAVTQDILVYAYIDSIACVNLGALGGGQSAYENKLREVSTTWWDPTAALPHTLDVITYNKGGADLFGGAALLCVEEIVGTVPFSTTKECVCPYCDHKQIEPVSVTRITCQGCGKEYMVTNFASLRQLGG